jgi:hypothetical protein
MKSDFNRELGYIVARSIGGSVTGFTDKRNLHEVKEELKLIAKISLFGGSHFINSRYFTFTPGNKSFTIGSPLGGRTLTIDESNHHLIMDWVMHAPKATNLADWRKKYGK